MKYYFGLIGLLLAASVNAAPIGSAFTYQGQLNKEGGPVVAPHDFEFGLYDAGLAGTQIGTTLTLTAVPVNKGLFSVPLDFGATAFGADARYLQIQVKPTGEPTYASLAPRVPITPVPVALTALTAQSAISAQTAAIASSVAPSSIGTDALQEGAVGWGQLSPNLFPVFLATKHSGQLITGNSLLDFPTIVRTTPNFTHPNGNYGIIRVGEAGLYRIDLCLTLTLGATTCNYKINRNGFPAASFRELSQFDSNSDHRVTVAEFLTLRAGDTVSVTASPSNVSFMVLGANDVRYSYISITKVQ